MSEDLDLKRPPRKKKTKKQTKRQYVSPDGKGRQEDVERKLNEAFAICFSSVTGQMVRNYLRSVSVNSCLPPGTPMETITYMEGARWLMGIIDSRIKDGEDKKP